MNARDAIRLGLNQAKMISTGYLADLTDADLLVRPVPGANHIAWQLGHLIASAHMMVEGICPGSMPALPAGFAEKYTTESSKLDSPGAFHPKAVYLDLYEKQNAAIGKALDKLTDADLDKKTPEQFQSYAPTYGDLMTMQGTHWIMHAGQWAIIRRKLGKPPLF